MGKLKLDALGQPKEYTYRHSSHLVGMSHVNKNGNDRRRLARRLKVGSQLVLKAEPDNPADQDAILVYSVDDGTNDIGYLYSFTARHVARKWRGGATFSAEVYEIDRSDDRYPIYRIYVYQLSKVVAKEPKREPDEYYKAEQRYFGNSIVFPAHHAPRRTEGNDSGTSQESDSLTITLIDTEINFEESAPKGIFKLLARWFRL